MTTEFWRRWLLLASLLIGGYAVSLVVAGAVAEQLFGALDFGMASGSIPDGRPRDYVLFVYGVLGAVLLGWMVLIAGVAAGPLRTGEPWAWPALAASLTAWFVLDTGMSLWIGLWQHAAFNVVFFCALGLPLAGWRGAVKKAAE
jgi:hypothetical protein